jgi:hypothetical protein
MTPPAQVPDPPPLESREAFAAALIWGLEAAAARNARCIVCSSPRFDAWPLDDPRWLDALQGWLRRPRRRLLMLARHYDEVPRCHPRFTRWRRDWVHAIDTVAPASGWEGTVPTLLLDDGPVSVHLADALRWRGRAAVDPGLARQWRQDIDEILMECEPAFPVNSLGL